MNAPKPVVSNIEIETYQDDNTGKKIVILPEDDFYEICEQANQYTAALVELCHFRNMVDELMAITKDAAVLDLVQQTLEEVEKVTRSWGNFRPY